MSAIKGDASYDNIIFVSEDDTYRGPVASALLQKTLPWGYVNVSSKGLVVLFNEPPNPKGVQILNEMGIDISGHSSVQMTADDFGSNTLVIMMTERGKRRLYERFSNATNVYTLKEISGSNGDVEAPYGKDIEEYRTSVAEIKELIEKLAEIIRLELEEVNR